jgi:hypothetical protein
MMNDDCRPVCGRLNVDDGRLFERRWQGVELRLGGDGDGFHAAQPSAAAGATARFM